MDNELTHYGVLGMKWGIRRSKAQLSRAIGSSNKSSNNGNKKNVKTKLKSKKKVILAPYIEKSAKGKKDKTILKEQLPLVVLLQTIFLKIGKRH